MPKGKIRPTDLVKITKWLAVGLKCNYNGEMHSVRRETQEDGFLTSQSRNGVGRPAGVLNDLGCMNYKLIAG